MSLATCHSNRVNKGRGLCGCCYDKWLKSVNSEYRQRQLSNATEWRLRNPDKKKATYERRKAKQKLDPAYKAFRRNQILKSKYGITQAEYDIMLSNQNGGCAICFRKPGKRPLHVDHDHSTGQVRGLLCHQCNWYLATVESDEAILLRLEAYLHRETYKPF
jgi:hypothetical protein